MNSLIRFSHSRASWLLLFLSSTLLEAAALFFQYGMDLAPCVMCIYIRVAVLGLMFAGLIGLISPQRLLVRLLAGALWAASSIWGLLKAAELVDIQTNPSPFATCAFLPDFPKSLPLHEWIPSVFMPTGMCTDTPWELMGITMASWMLVAFSGYIAALILFLFPMLSKKPSKTLNMSCS